MGATLACLLALAACGTAPTARTTAAADGGVRTKLDGWGPKTPPRGLPKFVDHSVGQEEISMQAMGLVGIPYRWGGNTPAAGFDCSGLVRYVVENAADVQLPRTTSQMRYAGTSVEPDEIAPGDLVFFNTDGRPYSHVGVYVGNYRFVNAPSTGGTVRIDYISNPYWARHFNGIRRIAGRRATAPIRIDPNAPLAPIAPDSAYAQSQTPSRDTTTGMTSNAAIESNGPQTTATSDAAPTRRDAEAMALSSPPPTQATRPTGVTTPVAAHALPSAPVPRPTSWARSAGASDDPIGAVIARADQQRAAADDPIGRIAAQSR